MKRRPTFRPDTDPDFQAFAEKLIAETRLASLPPLADSEPDTSVAIQATPEEKVTLEIQSDLVDSPETKEEPAPAALVIVDSAAVDSETGEKAELLALVEGAALQLTGQAEVVGESDAAVDSDKNIAPLFSVQPLPPSNESAFTEVSKPSSSERALSSRPEPRGGPVRSVGGSRTGRSPKIISAAKSLPTAKAGRPSVPMPKSDQSLYELTEFLRDLPVSLPANGRYSASYGKLLIPAELMNLLRVLPKYMAGLEVSENGDTHPDAFRIDDLACFLLREFLKENIASFQAMVRALYLST